MEKDLVETEMKSKDFYYFAVAADLEMEEISCGWDPSYQLHHTRKSKARAMRMLASCEAVCRLAWSV